MTRKTEIQGRLGDTRGPMATTAVRNAVHTGMLAAITEVSKKYTLAQLRDETFAIPEIQTMYNYVRDEKKKDKLSHYFISAGVTRLGELEAYTSDQITNMIEAVNLNLFGYTAFHSFTELVWECSPNGYVNLHILAPILNTGRTRTDRVRTQVFNAISNAGFKCTNNPKIIQVLTKTPRDIAALKRRHYLTKEGEGDEADFDSNFAFRETFALQDVYYSPDFRALPEK